MKLKRLYTFTCIMVLSIIILATPPNARVEPVVDAAHRVANAVDPKQLTCLAKNIFFEAGGEPVLGQAAVARVVLNRINHGFAPTPCGVIYQTARVKKETEDGEVLSAKACQFQWVCENKTEPNKNSSRYQQAKAIAYEVLAHDAYSDVVPKTILYFHNTSVKPSLQYNEVKKIGNHIFYSKSKKKKAKQLSYPELSNGKSQI